MKITINLLTLITMLALTACAPSPPRPAQIKGDDYAYTRDYIRWMISEKMTEHDIVGLSIALVDDQKIVWAEGFGYADWKNRIKATPETIYRVGSITKLFTATATMHLAEQNKLDIDQPLQRYLPQFSIKSRFSKSAPITPRTLMTHHSGLPSDRINHMWGDETAHFTELATALRDEYVAYPPNTIGAYSNLGFSLLGHLVEEVSGTPYAEYVEQQILRPAGMSHAYIAANLRDDGQSSKGYFNHEETATPYLRDTPAGGLNSSVVDLAHFAQTIFADGRGKGTRILLPKTLAQMQHYQDGTATFDVSHSIGLAWVLDDSLGNEAGLIARHNGGTPMFKSDLLTLPKHKLAVVVLANSDTAARVVSEISNQTLKLALESKTGIKVRKPPELTQKLPILADDLVRIPGIWSSPAGLVQVTRSGSGLEAEVNGETLDLVRREDGHYHLHYKLLGLLPIGLGGLEKVGLGYQRIAGHDVMTLYRDGQPRAVIAEKTNPQSLSAHWHEYLGDYEVTNAKGSVILRKVELRYKDGLLQARCDIKTIPGDENAFTVALLPVSENEAVIHGLGRSKGDTVRFIERDGETLMSYSGFLLRKTR
jgi:CubicO group peptidase (beta-lactamase class C family)